MAKKFEEHQLIRLKVPHHLVVQFAWHFSMMLRSGVPILACLDSLGMQLECPDFGRIVNSIAGRLQGGHKLSSSLALYPRVFPAIFVTMVAIGEKTGGLDSALRRVSIWLEKDASLAQQLRAALRYPLVVFSVSALLTLAVFTTALPGFSEIFTSMHIALPVLTRVVLGFTKVLISPIFWILTALAVAGAIRVYYREMEIPEGRARLFRWALCLPVISNLLHNASCARYCSAAAALVDVGLDSRITFRLAAQASGNPLLLEDCESLISSLTMGDQLSKHMDQCVDLYPRILVMLIKTGESTSRLPEMLASAATYFEVETESTIQALKAAVEPVMLIAVASVVSIVVLAIFLPMYSFLDNL